MQTRTDVSPRARNLHTTLARAFFSLSAVVLILYTGLQTFYAFKAHEALVISKQQLVAQEAAKTVRGFMDDNFSILETAIWLNNFDGMSAAEQRKILRSLLGLRTAFRRLVLLNDQDQILAQASRLSIEKTRQFTDMLKHVMPWQNSQANRRISQVYIDRVTSEPMLAIAVPVTSIFGNDRGTLIAELNLKFLWDIVDRLKVGLTGYVYVSDRKGRLIAFHDTARVLRGENVSNLKAVADFIENHDFVQPGSADRYQGIMGSSVLATYAPLNTPDWAVITELPWEEAYQEIIRKVVMDAGITLAMAIFAGIFGIFMARRIAVPVIDLTNTASRIAAGERDLQAAMGGPKEVVQLAVAFNSMTAQLRQTLKNLEQRFFDLKRTQEALRLNEERLRLALDGASDGIWDWNLQTGQVYFSPRYYTMMGYQPDEFPAAYENWRRLLHPDDVEPSEKAVQRAIIEHTPYAIEFRFKAKNGDWRWILARGKVAEADTDGKAIRVAGSHADITDRKKAEEALRASEAFLETIIEQSPYAMWVSNDQGTMIRMNQTCRDLLHVADEDLVGKYNIFEDNVTKEQGVMPLVNGVFERGEKARFILRYDSSQLRSLQLKETVSVVLEITISPVTSSAGRVVHAIIQLVDITEREKAEEALRKYERIVSTSQDLMALISRGYIYEAVNERLLTAHAKRQDEVVGRTVPELVGASVFREKIQPRLDQALAGQTHNFEESFEFSGIGRRVMNVSYFPIFDKMGKVIGVVLNSRDITETRKLEERLMQSQKIESLGTLASGVAHEINNPINGIMNYAQLIIDRSPKDGPAVELAGEIIHETDRVATIVRNLLTFARHEKQSHSPAYISDIVSSVLSLIRAVMRHDQIDLQVDIEEGLPQIKCRSQQIQQVLMNLLTNARDSLNERYPQYDPGKKLRIEARRLMKQDKKFIRTTVEDCGSGILPSIRERIFDPFFTTKPKEIGTGLGLSISYGIVKEHAGELIVESEPGVYTRFHVDLPVNNGWTLPAK